MSASTPEAEMVKLDKMAWHRNDPKRKNQSRCPTCGDVSVVRYENIGNCPDAWHSSWHFNNSITRPEAEMKNIIVADTRAALEAFRYFRVQIEAAAERYPVVIGPSGVVFYDPREFSPHAAGALVSGG